MSESVRVWKGSMRSFCAVVLIPAMLAFSAYAKKPRDMSISMMSLEACDALFYVEQDPNPFLKDVVEFKDKGVVKFRHGTQVFENPPAPVVRLPAPVVRTERTN